MYSIQLVSIVLPLYNEEKNIRLLAEEIVTVMKKTRYSYEIIFVNDGSNDNSWAVIDELSNMVPNIRGEDLAGNYGQTVALRCGFENAKGDVIVAMDSDLQHDPAYIPQFLKYIEEGYELVGGWKENRPDNFIKSFMANAAHKTICRISGVNLKYFGATFKAYRSYLLNNVNMVGDAHRYIGALVARKGTRIMEIPINIRERNAGESNYKLSKALYVIVDLVFLKFYVSYFNRPFRLFGIPGILIFLAGLLSTLVFTFGSLFFKWFINKDFQIEFQTSIFLMLFGFLLISMGLMSQIGIYIYYTNNKQKSYTVRDHTKLILHGQ
jgi:glycosyltransferase involved in cell wall biosynthesis